MSFPPFDSSAPTRTPPPLRPVYGQQAQYGAYDQPQYGAMGYGDVPQQQMPLRYPSTPGLAYPPQTEPYMGPSPSFSPTASQFAAQPYANDDMDAMSYQVPSIRRRYQSTGGVLQGHSHSTDPRYPTPRRPSGDMHMPTMHESYEVVPSQQPDSAPVARPGGTRSSSSGASSNVADSALALERPYECDICHTRFARQHDCRRHRETHAVNASGEKPHHCVVCGKSFTRKDALKRHTNQKGCDIAMGGSGYGMSRSARSSSSPQQVAGTFYPVGSLPPSGSHY